MEKSVDKTQMKTAILLTAQQMAREEDWESVSMRKIAHVLNCSAPTLYNYFKDKESILVALENEGFTTLHKRLKSIKKIEKDPKNLIISLSLQVYEFAAQNPEMYQVMFNLEGVKCKTGKKKLIKKVRDHFKLALSNFTSNKKEIKENYLIWWSFIHGYVSLLITEQLVLSDKKAKKRMERMVEHLFQTQFTN